MKRRIALLAFWIAFAAGQPPRQSEAVRRVVSEISEDRIGSIMRTLEGFGTRHILSEKDDPAHGIGAAQNWILQELKSYSPRLQVSLDPFTAKKSNRVPEDTPLANIVAVLPGKTDP